MTDEPEEETALQVARLGVEVEKEIASSPTVALILEHAGEVSDEALRELKECDPTDARRIAALQAKAGWYDQIEGWINQTIMAGRNAAEALQRPSEEDGDEPA